MLQRILTLVFVSYPNAAVSHQPTGSITGAVTDPSGEVVPGVNVIITNKDTAARIVTTTTAAGIYSSGSLLPGRYEVRVEASGFKTTLLEVTVQVGVTTEADVRLQVGMADQTVRVEGESVAVSPTETTLQGVITSTLIKELPLNGRNFLDLGQMEPGVQIQDGGNFDPMKSQFSSLLLASQSGRTTRITVDGVDISDETVGTTTQNISQDSIQEFQISRSPFGVQALACPEQRAQAKGQALATHNSLCRRVSEAAEMRLNPVGAHVRADECHAGPIDRKLFGFAPNGSATWRVL